MTAIKIALSTASVFPERTPDAFETAARLGYDALEVMVTADPVSQDAAVLRKLSDYHGIPVVAVHAPNLLITQRVWGRDPWRSWQNRTSWPRRSAPASSSCTRRSAGSASTPRTSRTASPAMSEQGDVAFAVENLYPLLRGETEVAAYAPHWNPVEMESAAATLDVSHAAVSGSDVLAMAEALGDRLAHVHLGDGTKPGLPDEHLVPGRGTQPCAELLGWLSQTGYDGHVVLEVSTHRAPTLATGRPTWPSRWTSPGATWQERQPGRRGHACWRLGLQYQRHRPVVDELHLHVSAEDAGLRRGRRARAARRRRRSPAARPPAPARPPPARPPPLGRCRRTA